MFDQEINRIEFMIMKLLSDGLYQWISLEDSYWQLYGVVGGLSFIIGWALKGSFPGFLFNLIFGLSVIIQPVLYLSITWLTEKIWEQGYVIEESHIIAYSVGFLVAAVFGFLMIRQLVGSLDGLKDIFVKRTSLERITRTDIRNMDTELPTAKKQYDPLRYIKSTNKIFFGVDKFNRPKFIKQDFWRSSHVDLIGTTGSGKGIAAGLMMTQAVNQGESVIAIDPKNDEFLPYVLGQAAAKAKVPFYYIDLQGEQHQWNPLANKSSLEIEEIFSAGFGLSEQGTDADFYRLNDRKFARLFAMHIVGQKMSIPQAFADFMKTNGDLLKDAPKFYEDLEEIVSLSVTHINEGLNLSQAIKEGAVIYVRGSMRNPRILKLQKMFVLSVMQSCENRIRESARHVCIFLDEFKYLISKPALEALGAIRDKRAHVMLAHQSLGDLRDCPQDIDPDSVVASINENCSIKLTYKVNDPDTADWLARMSGKILVDDEMRSIKTTIALTEIKNPDRMLRQTERCLIDTNMLQSLPSRCAVLYGNGLADFVFTSPIKVTKDKQYVTPTEFSEEINPIMENKDHINSAPIQINSMAEELLNVD